MIRVWSAADKPLSIPMSHLAFLSVARMPICRRHDLGMSQRSPATQNPSLSQSAVWQSGGIQNAAIHYNAPDSQSAVAVVVVLLSVEHAVNTEPSLICLNAPSTHPAADTRRQINHDLWTTFRGPLGGNHQCPPSSVSQGNNWMVMMIMGGTIIRIKRRTEGPPLPLWLSAGGGGQDKCII